MMRNWCHKWWLFGCCLLLVVGCVAHNTQHIRNQQVKLYVAGNEPFTRLMAEFPDGEVMEINPQSPQFQQLWRLQGQTIVLVEGEVQHRNAHPTVLIRQFKINPDD